MIKREIEISGKMMPFRSSVTIPRLYRAKFKREMTTPLFLLRSVELGISIRDLDLLTIGLVLDMWTKKPMTA